MSKAKQRTKLDLERIVFIGRTYEEYLDMFSLSVEEWKGKKVLDCPSGACSFTSVGNKSGLEVTACDIAYNYLVEDLKNKGFKDIAHTMVNMEKAKENFIWDYFKDVEGLKKHRLSELEDCTEDMAKSARRYFPATLPSLPFKDGEFDTSFSTHFLFMYDDRLDTFEEIKVPYEFKEMLIQC